ncbi:MAG: hypothetical protein MJ252_08460 [archaeon]|nr:hypothetical protein [archaeon]
MKDKYKNGNFSEEAIRFFRHSSVITCYGNRRVYQIQDINLEANPLNVAFTVNLGKGKKEDQNLATYYKKQYGIDIKDKTQPLLVVQDKNPSHSKCYLVPELVEMVGVDEERDENPNEMKKKLAARGRIKPYQKYQNLERIREVLLSRQQRNINVRGQNRTLSSAADQAKDWHLSFKGFKEGQAMILKKPVITFKDGNSEVGNNARFRAKNALEPVDFRRNDWICISCCDNDGQSYNDAKQMLTTLMRSSRNLGVRIEEPEIRSLGGKFNSVDKFMELLRKEDFTGKKLVFFVFSRRNKNLYGEAKKYLICDLGIPSQVVCNDNKGQNMSYYSNVLNQMVVKCGGQLFKIDMDSKFNENKFENSPIMIMAVDSSRAGVGRAKFVFTSSYDMHYSKFYTQTLLCDQNTEDKQSIIRQGVTNALVYFQNKTGKLPKIVLVYRNGGNEKQKILLYEQELPQFKEILGVGCQSTYDPNYSAQLCFVCVNNRTDMIFIEKKGDKFNNPANGTVIDQSVTNPDFYEFYMQPQFVNQGIAHPIHFHVIFDTTGIPIEVLENITYKQTYYYWNWNGPIKVPAVLKFAEKETEFYSKYLGNADPQQTILHTPFYI